MKAISLDLCIEILEIEKEMLVNQSSLKEHLPSLLARQAVVMDQHWGQGVSRDRERNRNQSRQTRNLQSLLQEAIRSTRLMHQGLPRTLNHDHV